MKSCLHIRTASGQKDEMFKPGIVLLPEQKRGDLS